MLKEVFNHPDVQGRVIPQIHQVKIWRPADVRTLCRCSLSVLFSVLRVCSESVGAWKPAYSCLYYIHGLSEKSQQVAFVDLK